jgi:hypothetical protein
MASVFLPFIGQYYNQGIFGKKVLVLGESHYCDEKTKPEEFKDVTRNCVQAFLDKNAERERWMNTYRKFERALANKATSFEDSARIWDSLIFYNYLQEPMSKPRECGTLKQYKDAAEPFFETLNCYQPDVVIVWGIRLYNQMPNENWEDGHQEIVVNDYKINYGYYNMSNGKKITVLAIRHPSCPFSWTFWHKVLKTIICETI